MSVIKKLKQYTNYSETEKDIVKFIFKNPDVLLKSTAKDLASLTQSSPSTIVRFCQKLGFLGYNDFKIQFAHDSQATIPSFDSDANYPFNHGDDLHTIIQKMSKLQLEAINETLLLVELNEYKKAVQLLYDSEVIDIYGAGINIHLAADFNYKLRRIGRRIDLPLNSQDQLFNAARSSFNHCALIISYSGESENVLKYANILKQSHTPIISITSLGTNTLSQLSDITLHIASKETLSSKIGTFSSRLSIMMILDFLYAGIFEKDYDKNKEYTKRISKIVMAQNLNGSTLENN
ncbi:MurR/RpiR family transcriptional regulator [Niallia taxi]|uniref:MurR/RpiR family transcriptional regulator n=1 Tax=Niallia taxi TaxID=2499688 RepID=A0A437K6E5_9BACI|nr:MurR/RpiR family transcriptional regulator [Niallia taxi]MCM3216956.1 MurR/RpiR family transcriptional regulator [Niallia taxi]MDK8641615.1 MurR/RpiR family transcriptional regulator [Niallia taxi]MED4039841.1 MurR/RpiR family transcriptional regulator [Niallia taxi]MED4056094.1 MurR/RpiR family transcriptional regulator [Niallia taxi]MED4120868.1 MurR/RpiR family transcriptional regulator [Niallia taxi]